MHYRFQMNNKNFLFYIQVHTKLNIQPKLTHNELYSVFDDRNPSYNTVRGSFEKINYDLVDL